MLEGVLRTAGEHYSPKLYSAADPACYTVKVSGKAWQVIHGMNSHGHNQLSDWSSGSSLGGIHACAVSSHKKHMAGSQSVLGRFMSTLHKLRSEKGTLH